MPISSKEKTCDNASVHHLIKKTEFWNSLLSDHPKSSGIICHQITQQPLQDLRPRGTKHCRALQRQLLHLDHFQHNCHLGCCTELRSHRHSGWLQCATSTPPQLPGMLRQHYAFHLGPIPIQTVGHHGQQMPAGSCLGCRHLRTRRDPHSPHVHCTHIPLEVDTTQLL